MSGCTVLEQAPRRPNGHLSRWMVSKVSKKYRIISRSEHKQIRPEQSRTPPPIPRRTELMLRAFRAWMSLSTMDRPGTNWLTSKCQGKLFFTMLVPWKNRERPWASMKCWVSGLTRTILDRSASTTWRTVRTTAPMAAEMERGFMFGRSG